MPLTLQHCTPVRKETIHIPFNTVIPLLLLNMYVTISWSDPKSLYIDPANLYIDPASLYIDPANLYIVPMFNREPQTKRATQVLIHIYIYIYISSIFRGCRRVSGALHRRPGRGPRSSRVRWDSTEATGDSRCLATKQHAAGWTPVIPGGCGTPPAIQHLAMEKHNV